MAEKPETVDEEYFRIFAKILWWNQSSCEEFSESILISQPCVAKLQETGISVTNEGIIRPGKKGLYRVSWKAIMDVARSDQKKLADQAFIDQQTQSGSQ
jgi:hypothetical protein